MNGPDQPRSGREGPGLDGPRTREPQSEGADCEPLRVRTMVRTGFAPEKPSATRGCRTSNPARSKSGMSPGRVRSDTATALISRKPARLLPRCEPSRVRTRKKTLSLAIIRAKAPRIAPWPAEDPSHPPAPSWGRAGRVRRAVRPRQPRADRRDRHRTARQRRAVRASHRCKRDTNRMPRLSRLSDRTARPAWRGTDPAAPAGITDRTTPPEPRPRQKLKPQ